VAGAAAVFDDAGASVDSGQHCRNDAASVTLCCLQSP
jgi:hypothetical protein